MELPRPGVKTRKKRGKAGGKWARCGLKRVNKEGTGGITWRMRFTKGSRAAAALVACRSKHTCGPPTLSAKHKARE